MTICQTVRDLDFENDFDSPEWQDIAVNICRHAGVAFSILKRAPSSDHVVFLIDERFVLKIFRPSRNCFERESKALEFVSGRLAFETPEIVYIGDLEGLDFLITTQVLGEPFTRAEFLQLPQLDRSAVCNDLALCLKQIHGLNPSSFTDNWCDFIHERADTFVERQIKHGVNAGIISLLPQFIDAHFSGVPKQPTTFLHGDLHFGNLRLHRVNGRMQIAGLFDFADSRRGFHEYDFLAVGVLMLQGARDLQREFFLSYGYSENDLDDAMRSRLMMLTMLYETSDLRRYALRLRSDAVELTLEELESAIWSFV